MEKIRFPLMSLKIVQESVEPRNVVPDRLLLEVYRYFNAPPDKRGKLVVISLR